MAAPMSPRKAPGWAAAMPAYMACRVASTSWRVAAGTSPTIQLRAASPCQPSTMAPASTDTIWPSAMRRLPGTPWTTSLSMLMHSECWYGAWVPGTPTNDGMPPPARMSSRAMLVELEGGDARPDGRADGVQDVRDELARHGHAPDLAGALERDPPVVERHRQARLEARSATRSRSAVTSSMGRSPGTACSTPVSA